MGLAYAVVRHFFLLWAVGVMGAVYIGLRRGRPDATTSDGSRPSPFARGPNLKWPQLHDLSTGEIVAGGAFGLFLASYATFILWKEDFAFPDNDMFTVLLASKGVRIPFSIWPAEGRFFPLAHYEFNFLVPFGVTAQRCHIMVIGQLVVFCALYAAGLRGFTALQRIAVLVFVMITPGFAIAFSGLVYPERNVVFWVAVLVLAVERYDSAPERLSLGVALVATQFALYYKEPVFLAMAGFASARLLLRARAGDRTRGSIGRLLAASPLETGMLGLCGVFVGLFGVTMLGRAGEDYKSRISVGALAAAWHYAHIDSVFVVFVGVAVVDWVRTWRAGGDFEPVWDPLAVGAILYGGCVIALGLSTDHYLLPADVIAVPVLCRIARKWHLGRPWLRLPFATAAAAVTVVTAGLGAYRVIERKNIVIGTEELVRLVEEALASNPEIHLYFPFSARPSVTRVAALLTSRGLSRPEHEARGFHGPGVDILSPLPFAGDRCVSYRSYVCHHEDGPAPGDLVVMLPEDKPDPGTKGAVLAHSRAVFAFEPLGVPERLRDWLSVAFVVSPCFDGNPVPDDWLRLRVWRW